MTTTRNAAPKTTPLRVLASSSARLHLGAGSQRLPGFLNCDLFPADGIDHAFDLCGEWPFETDFASEVYASHVLEHLSDPLAFFAELWRVCRPMAQITLRMPYGGHKAAWWDLTHVRPWYPENFCMFQPSYAARIGNPQHEAWRMPFVIHRVDLRVTDRLFPLLRYKLLRRLILPRLDYFSNVYEEFWVSMSPLKMEGDTRAYLETHDPRYIPARVVVFAHDWAGDPLPEESVALQAIGEGVLGIG